MTDENEQAVVRDTHGKGKERPQIVLGAKTSDAGRPAPPAELPELAMPPETP